MSLLTDALRLREGRRPSRGEVGPSFPPFRGPQPARWVIGFLLVFFLVLLGVWKGPWLLEKIEGLAGIPPELGHPNLLATAPRREARSEEKMAGGLPQKKDPLLESPAKPAAPAVQPPAAVAEAVPSPVRPAAPAKSPARAGSDPKAGAVVPEISEEGKRRGEILLTDEAMKGVAEKPVAVPTAAPAEEPKAATVPAGGLQPMKVELAMQELVTETPEEKQKKWETAVEEFLRLLKVQGVRLQGKESRILVDGTPVGLGEKVGGLGLMLESVEPQKIIFSDASGKKYPKSY